MVMILPCSYKENPFTLKELQRSAALAPGPVNNKKRPDCSYSRALPDFLRIPLHAGSPLA